MHNKFAHFLITGANGFIGRRLCAHLKQQNLFVTAVLKNNKQLTGIEHLWDQAVICDFNNHNNNLVEQLTNLPNNNIDAIIHLANIAHTDAQLPWETYWQINVQSTLALLNYATTANIKAFLYLSSIKAAAIPNTNMCFDESLTTWPNKQDFYGFSKRMAEDLLQTAANQTKLHICILRPSLVYGPEVKGYLNLLIKLAKKRLLPNLPETYNKRSMIHIDDLIEAMLLAIYNPQAHKKIFIVSDNQQYSTKQICDHLNNQIPKNNLLRFLQYITIPYCVLTMAAKCADFLQFVLRHKFCFNSLILKKLFSNSCFTSARIQASLNWKPKYTFFDTKI